jgi:hypothetical protein
MATWPTLRRYLEMLTTLVTRNLMIEYLRKHYGNIDVLWTQHLDGAGWDFGQTLVPFVKERIGPVESARAS